eukprot:TRINITY_DN5086_c1_g2_i2.p1 TRINITY_DN5086_c1_g2~~TRINITY_DN5086_c1_g2_i2.p1  ORF type:complete len:1083 (+),score=169.17 TRINITY_DN5086_c1_g2_i2:115-3249(+)
MKRESGFTTHFSGANASKQPLRIRRRDVQLLRKSIEGSVSQAERPSVTGRGRWEIRTNTAEYPEVPDTDFDNDDHRTAAIIEIGEKVRMLPIVKKDRIMQLITNFDSNANEDDSLTEINEIITRCDPSSASTQSRKLTPDWLDDKQVSPVKRSVGDNQLFSPQTSGRPTSGRRARTPAGYSSTPSTFGKGTQPGPGSITRNVSENSVLNPSRKNNFDDDLLSEYAEKNTLTKRPSYEDPLDVLQKQELQRHTRTPPPSSLVTSRVETKRTALTPPAGSLTDLESEDFSIPTLPEGRVLTINCIDTWGDPHYIGLNSIEIFDGDGEKIRIRDPKSQVSGNPESINVLPEYSNDPRVVQNVVDGVSRTCDDIHVWLAPFTPGSDHLITIDTQTVSRISMLRFWNYNKSRPHSYRGVKDVEIQLDGKFIFKGEISKAPGVLQGSEDQTEIILFTIDQHILSRIDEVIESQHELWRKEDTQNPAELMQTISRPTTSHGSDSRPGTTARGRGMSSGMTTGGGNATSDTTNIPKGETVIIQVTEWWDTHSTNIHAAFNEIQFLDNTDAVIRFSSTPLSPNSYSFNLKQSSFVSAIVIKNPFPGGVKRLQVTVDGVESSPEGGLYVKLNTSQFAMVPQKLLLSTRRAKNIPRGSSVSIEIMTNWGDMQNVGVNGIEFLSEEGDVIPATCENISTWPWNVAHGLVSGGPLILTFSFEKECSVYGVRIYNFNESLATTPRGIKRLRVHVNNVLSSPQSGHYIRKAPGTTSGTQFSQTIHLSTLQRDFNSTVTGSTMNKQVSDAVTRARLSSKPFPKELLDILGYEPPLFPAAHVFRLELTGTHGDQYYIGLNGIELFDVRNESIPLSSSNMEAIPRDITVLPNNKNDLRILPNLVDGVNSSSDDNHIWLAPYLPGTVSLVYVIFEEPVAVSRIAIWNYSKTPSRGAQQVTVYADESVIYSGSLKRAPDIGSDDSIDFSQHMIFTNDLSVAGLDIIQSNPSSQDSSGGVLFYDSGKVSALEEEMPQTSCGRPTTNSKRPSMAATRSAGYRGSGF